MRSNNAYNISYILRRRGIDIKLVSLVIAKDEETALQLVEKASEKKRETMQEEHSFVLVNIKKSKYDFLLVE